jgi:hypothetical protein
LYSCLSGLVDTPFNSKSCNFQKFCGVPLYYKVEAFCPPEGTGNTCEVAGNLGIVTLPEENSLIDRRGDRADGLPKLVIEIGSSAATMETDTANTRRRITA